jgi:TolB protein
MLSRLITLLLVFTLAGGIGLAGYMIYSNLPPPPAPPPAIEFNSVEVGPIVTLAVTARGVRVTRAELWSGETLIAREVNPNPGLAETWNIAWQWQPPAPGVYPLVARAYDEQGGYGASSLFNVVIPPAAKILFASNREGSYALYELETGTRATGLWQVPGSEDRQAAAAPNGTVAFTRIKDGRWQLMLRAPGNRAPVALAPDLQAPRRPAWSADGKQLAFEATAGGVTNVYVADGDGKNLRRLTDGDAYDGQATFHPSGDRIAFAAERGGQWDIYSVRLDGTELARLTPDPAQDAQPAWSPDGARIAFVSNRSGVGQVWVMNADGTAPVRLTNIPTGAEQPRWSPDGQWLAFVAYTGAGEGSNRRELYLLHAPPGLNEAALSGLVRLTQNDKDDTEPAWLLK